MDLRPVLRQVCALLGKLTPEKFDALSRLLTALLVEHEAASKLLLPEVVSLICQKAIAESSFAGMYAQLCLDLSKAMPRSEEGDSATYQPNLRLRGKSHTFLQVIFDRCLDEIEAGVTLVVDEGLSSEELAARTAKRRRRLLGAVKWIGELFVRGLLNAKVMQDCVGLLIDKDREALCTLLSTAGKACDRMQLQACWKRIKLWRHSLQSPSRLRTQCAELIERKNRGWERSSPGTGSHAGAKVQSQLQQLHTRPRRHLRIRALIEAHCCASCFEVHLPRERRGHQPVSDSASLFASAFAPDSAGTEPSEQCSLCPPCLCTVSRSVRRSHATIAANCAACSTSAEQQAAEAS